MSITPASQQRHKLTEAAIEVMRESGLEAATTRRVAEQAGVPKATFHYVFENKDELLVSVIDAMAERVKSALGAKLLESRDEARIEVALPAMLHHYWDFIEADVEFQVTQLELTLHCLRRPEAHWLAQRQYDIYCAMAEEALRTALTAEGRGRSIDTAVTARRVVAALDGLTIQLLTHRDKRLARVDLEKLAAELLLTLTTDSAPTSVDNEPLNRAQDGSGPS